MGRIRISIPIKIQKYIAIIVGIYLAISIPCIIYENSALGSIKGIRKTEHTAIDELRPCRDHLRQHEKYKSEVEDTILAFCKRNSLSKKEEVKYLFSGFNVEKRIDSLILYFGPNEEECIQRAEGFLGFKLGRKYQLFDYYYYQPKRQWRFSIKLPSDVFQKVVRYCEEETKMNDGQFSKSSFLNKTYIDSFFRTRQGYKKGLEILSGNEREYYQALIVDLGGEVITFDATDY